MWKPILAPLAAAVASLALANPACAASLTPPNLVTASSLNNPDLLLVWPYAAGGPLEAMSWSTFKSQMAGGLAGDFLTPSNNLSDVGNATVARGNLGVTATGTDTTYAYRADNLSDLGSASAARTNLGLGTAATQNTGTSGATVPVLNANNTYGATSATEILSGHIEETGNSGTTSVTSCGTSPGGSAYDNKGTVSIGSGTVTSCTIGFSKTWTNTPVCVATMYAGSPSSLIISVTSLTTTGFSVGFSSNAAGANFVYHCI